MKNLDILKSGIRTMTSSTYSGSYIHIKLKSRTEMRLAFDALTDLMNAPIDTPIGTPTDIAPEFVNVEPCHDYGVE